MTIIVFGSINLDIALGVDHLPSPGETVLSEGYQAVPGGKGCNQAVAAAKLGAAHGVGVRMVGAVGDDAWASIPLAAMEAAGVDTDGVRITDAPTGLASVMVADDGENAIIVASGANRKVQADQLTGLRAGDVLVCQMEVPFEETADALLMAKAAGGITVLNLAPFGELPERAWGAVDYWLVNELEGRALAEQVGLMAVVDPAYLAEHLADRLKATVIVTLGGEGAVAAAADGTGWRAAALPVDVVDTTGAGDAFTGGLAAALANGDVLPDALKLASAAAGLTCTAFGAQAGLATGTGTASRLKKIRVEPL